MARQLSFDLPAREVLGREDFFVAPSNAMAVALIDDPAGWPTPQLVLTGPEGAGKTHLTHVWADRMGARLVAARDLAGADLLMLAEGAVAVEDVPQIAHDGAALNSLFHLFNLMREAGRPLLLTGRGAPSHWTLSLPDAQSRIESALHVTLDAPDDALLAAVLAKLFADRQITPRPDVIPYLVGRIERSFAAAADAVARLDRAALSEKRMLSRQLAIRLIGQPPEGD